MNSEQCSELIAALPDRYGIELDTHGWDSKEVPGGVALSDELVSRISASASLFDDRNAVAYEMESTTKEFQPLPVSLDKPGFDALRHSLLSHFDLVLVPRSRKWALVLSHDLEGQVLGPKQFVAPL